MVIIFVFSNKTHFQTAIPLLERLKDTYEFIAIFNLSNKQYSSGLEEYFLTYQHYFKENLCLENGVTKINHLSNLFKVKKFIKTIMLKYPIKSSIQFIEGADIDWLVIGLLREKDIRTVVLQWAITWEPIYYDEMKKNKFKAMLKRNLYKIFKVLLGLNYRTMQYLGDGNAKYLVTMGDFWTEQFSRHHAYPNKFISVGNPRFLDLIKLRDIKNKDKILFITGAGTSLYGYAKNKHLEDIKEIYEAYAKANCKNSLIHKLHPRDKYVEEIILLSKQYSNIKIETKKSTSELLAHTLLTIIIRSTVGLEALIAGSKLVVYNNESQVIGFNYAKYNLAREVYNTNELRGLLQSIETLNIVDKKVVEFYIKTKNIVEDIVDVITKNQ